MIADSPPVDGFNGSLGGVGVKLSTFGGFFRLFAQGLAVEREAVRGVDEAIKDGIGDCRVDDAFVDELAVILRFAFDYIRKAGDDAPSERNWLRDETGGSVYLRLSTRPVEQIQRDMTPELRQSIVDGAYWLREPGPNCQVIIAYTGAIAPEAIQAAGTDRRRPPGRGPPRHHVGGSAQRRLDRGAASA
jgi:hypothetical protein